ncbi:MAG TPA: tRNA (adenosine(37)-N6)-dimethylallyltransferase MiaA [bacterium]|nr:tRNA (adenosine(37)-N6)-dimethylallyltransferase MiaA [bacterium]
MPGGGPLLVVVCGPTAIGKTAAAITLAPRLNAEIVCADSRTVYRGMDIGTAKPTLAQRARVPHHLLDIAEPNEVVTLATYRDKAVQVITDLRSRRRVPLLTGGSGLYIRAVVDGFTIPKVPPDAAMRAQMESDEAAQPGRLHAKLQRVDPGAAARIHPRNIRRLVRALEVYEQTGQPISSLQRRDPIGAAVQVGLTMDREALYSRIDARVDEQLAAGLVAEVEQLLAQGYPATLSAMRGLGYKEIVEYLQGRVGLLEVVHRLKLNTRHFAKRQFTWFRRDSRIRWLDVTTLTSDQVAEEIGRMIQ